MDFENNFDQTIEEMFNVGRKYATAHAQSAYLKEMKGVILADLILRTEGKSQTERKEKALASEEYRTCVKGWAEALRQEHILKSDYACEFAKHDKNKSLCSQETAKIRLT